MPGGIRSMDVEHVFRDVQTDRGSLLHGRLLRWQLDTATLAHRCRRGASTPSPTAADFHTIKDGPPSTSQRTFSDALAAMPALPHTCRSQYPPGSVGRKSDMVTALPP